MLDLFRTRFFFAVSDNHIAEYASKSLGEVEVNETTENLSYGSNTMRDGVNINSAKKIKRLVLPDEVKNLPERTCFVKLCGNYPITKLQVNLQRQSRVLMFFYKLFTKSNRSNTRLITPQAKPDNKFTVDVAAQKPPPPPIHALNVGAIAQGSSIATLDIQEKLHTERLKSTPKTIKPQEERKLTPKQEMLNKLNNPEAI